MVYHYERTQPNDEPEYEGVDVAQQGHISRVEGKGSTSKRDNYIVVEAAKNISSEDIGQVVTERDQQDVQLRDNQNVVYAVIEKSKKKKQEKTQGGTNATTTQEVDTEEQHYEWGSVFGLDWFGNMVGESGRQE